MRRRARDLACVFGAALTFTSACDDSITKGWLVDRTRILGARVEAEVEPVRASIMPGERVKLTWLVASTSASPRLGWTFAVCAPPQGNFADPRCEGPVLASESGNGNGGALVDMAFAAPASSGDELLVLVAFCVDGAASLDPTLFRGACDGPTRAPLLASTTIHLVGAGRNANPPLGDDAIALDGVVLPPTAAGPPGSACAGAPDAPVVLANAGDRALVFRFREEQREATSEGARASHEALSLSHVVSGGELERQYSAFDADESAPKEVSLKWTPPPPEEVPDGGRIIELFFVLRDGRGGTTFARRAMCARKP